MDKMTQFIISVLVDRTRNPLDGLECWSFELSAGLDLLVIFICWKNTLLMTCYVTRL